MGDFLRLALDSIAYLWPFRLVDHWERAGLYVFGRWWKEVGPGCYLIVPFFMDVKTIPVCEAIVGTGRQDICLTDDTVLSFAATATVKVSNVYLALNAVDDYAETAQELLSSVLAERLADVDAARLTPEKRGRLLGDLRRWVAEEAAAYGVEVSRVRFTSFVLRAKVHRLLIDQNAAAKW